GRGRRLPRDHRRHGLPAADRRRRPRTLLPLPPRPPARPGRRRRRQLQLRPAHGEGVPRHAPAAGVGWVERSDTRRTEIPVPAHEKIDYVEYPARDLAATKRFFEQAFGWAFVDYGPDYAAFSGQGLDG